MNIISLNPLLPSVFLLRDRAMVVVSSDVVAPPLGKGDRGATSTEDSKRQDEQACKTCAIESASNKVRVVLEDARPVVAKVELGVEAYDGPAEENACLRLVVRDVTGVLDELGEIDFVDRELSNLRNELQQC